MELFTGFWNFHKLLGTIISVGETIRVVFIEWFSL